MKMVACGNRKVHGSTWRMQHHHSSSGAVRKCFATPGGIWSIEEAEMAEQDTYDPDVAYERHLEDAGWAEARLQEEREAALGIVQFEDYATRCDHSCMWSEELDGNDGPYYMVCQDHGTQGRRTRG